MIDTLKLARSLTERGMDPRQAEAFADVLNEGLKNSAVTKADLGEGLAKLRTELVVWMLGFDLALFGAIKVFIAT